MNCFHRIITAFITCFILPFATIKSLFADKERSFLIRLSSVLFTFFFIMPCLIVRILFTDEKTNLDKENCRQWLKSIYCSEHLANEIIEKLGEQESWQPNELLHFGLSEYLPNDTELFFIDWRDSDEFIWHINKIIEHHALENMNWISKNLEEDPPEELMQIAYEFLSPKGVVLYNAETEGDYYCLIAILESQRETFELASQKWGISVRDANQPF
ncbi:DUF6630 family protein [Pasteurella canis]|uniref:DUF6630 family protein n=1 Tax=Pasteurella canis TaxID=753 RepID=UPI001CBBA09A|nr:hypothetical protein [Pasteurella canis]UAX42831.1 hypothetical protein K7G89_000681 [Pasteurella canis]